MRSTAYSALFSICLISLVSCAASFVKPILLESGRLTYPEEQREANVEGSVLITYDIDVDGKVRNIRVFSSNPPQVFDEAAINFVRTWRFQPQKRDGVPESVANVESRISFTLEDGSASYLDFIEHR